MRWMDCRHDVARVEAQWWACDRGLDVPLKRVYSKEITRKYFRGMNPLPRQAV